MSRKLRHFLEPSVEDEIPGGTLSPKAVGRQEFGRRLLSLIIQRGWNQSDLARETGIGKDSISGYVRGRSFPNPTTLNQLCDTLGVTREQLLPNSLQAAMDEEFPAVELRQAVGHPSKAWLRVNRAMSFATAAKIITLIEEDEEHGEKTS
jgi:transcriptional regulator with XRE-family HTH domain